MLHCYKSCVRAMWGVGDHRSILLLKQTNCGKSFLKADTIVELLGPRHNPESQVHEAVSNFRATTTRGGTSGRINNCVGTYRNAATGGVWAASVSGSVWVIVPDSGFLDGNC
eukprot:1879774-Rhodomonas_salina.2